MIMTKIKPVLYFKYKVGINSTEDLFFINISCKFPSFTKKVNIWKGKQPSFSIEKFMLWSLDDKNSLNLPAWSREENRAKWHQRNGYRTPVSNHNANLEKKFMCTSSAKSDYWEKKSNHNANLEKKFLVQVVPNQITGRRNRIIMPISKKIYVYK